MNKNIAKGHRIFAPMTGNTYIMIADDDPDDQVLLQDAFRDTGYRGPIYTVDHGFAVVHHLEQCIDVLPGSIILDLNMPRLNGFEVLRFIKQSNLFASIPVFILTTSTFPDDREKCMAAGCNGFYIKPGSYQELVVIARSLSAAAKVGDKIV